MPNNRFLLLLVGVILAAGLTVWVGYLAIGGSGNWALVIPVVLGLALLVRLGLIRGRRGGSGD